MEQAKPRLIVVGPIPPPVHGVTVSTALVLKNTLLQEEFRLEHLDTSDHRSGANIGAWDRTNIALAARHVVELFRRTRREAGLVYLPLSQSTAGFLRDSLFILVAGRTGWKVSIHLRGGEFPGFYAARGRLMRWWIRSTLRRVTAAAVMGENLRSQFHDLVDRDRVAVVRKRTPDIRPGEGGAGRVVLFFCKLRPRQRALLALDA